MTDYKYGFDGMTRERMREKMQHGWRSAETHCGRGSEYDMTATVRRVLPALVADFAIETIADAGAGDLNWMRHVDWPHAVEYRAYDLVPRHPDVREWDITSRILPGQPDLILCRHVLNHLSVQLAYQALCAFKASGGHWLLTTNCDNQSAYWQSYGLRLLRPAEVFNDTLKWRLELHDLRREFFQLRRGQP